MVVAEALRCFCCSSNISLRNILPDGAALSALKMRMIHIVSRILQMHLPFLNKAKVKKHVKHAYSEEMAQRSELVYQ